MTDTVLRIATRVHRLAHSQLRGPRGPAGQSAPLSDVTPAPLGTPSAGVSTEANRADHVHEMPTAAQVGADPAGTAAGLVGAITPANIGAATAAQGAKADTAIQTETDPTVPGWAKQPNKPSYSAADISDLGSAATASTTDFATAAQGAKADTALQPADGLAALDSAASTKLGTIATGATANATDAQLRDRSTHTGTQAHTTITGLGDSATRNVGATAGTVAAGDDARLSDARTPTAHTHPLADLTQSGATANQVPAWNGSAWVPATLMTEYGVYLLHDTAIQPGGYPAARSAPQAGATTRLYVETDGAVDIEVVIGGTDVYSGSLAAGLHSIALATTIAAGDAVDFWVTSGTPKSVWVQIDGGTP